jgi:hypothetical protein
MTWELDTTLYYKFKSKNVFPHILFSSRLQKDSFEKIKEKLNQHFSNYTIMRTKSKTFYGFKTLEDATLFKLFFGEEELRYEFILKLKIIHNLPE